MGLHFQFFHCIVLLLFQFLKFKEYFSFPSRLLCGVHLTLQCSYLTLEFGSLHGSIDFIF